MVTLIINPLRAVLLCVLFLWIAPCIGRAQEPQTAFLLERKVITTKVGVTGIPAGTRVVIVSRHGDIITVKTAGQQFEVSPDQITTDPQTATLLSQREVREQEKLQRDAAEREAKYRESVANHQKVEASTLRQADKSSNAIDRQIDAIRKERELLKIELDRVKFEQKDLPPPNSSYRIRRKPYPNIVVRTSPNAFKLQEQRKGIERRLMELNAQERLLKMQAR